MSDNLEITISDVKSIISTDAQPSSSPELIDVREEWELSRGILPGARHMPLSRFQDFLPHFTPDRKYIIYCEHGIRSLDVAAYLQGNKNIDAQSMHGGFAEWTGPVSQYSPSDDPTP